MINSALIIREPWIGLILSGKKTWEMRSLPTKKRGKDRLDTKGHRSCGRHCRLVDCLPPLDIDVYMDHFDRHQIPEHMLEAVEEKRWVYPWVISDARALRTPVPYAHRSGAVRFVNLDPGVSAQIEAQL